VTVKTAKTYSVSPTAFAEQMKTLQTMATKLFYRNQFKRYIDCKVVAPKKTRPNTFDDTHCEEHYYIEHNQEMKNGV
jgi:hypothetical protein